MYSRDKVQGHSEDRLRKQELVHRKRYREYNDLFQQLDQHSTRLNGVGPADPAHAPEKNNGNK